MEGHHRLQMASYPTRRALAVRKITLWPEDRST
jgi:hypothetical protein